MIGRREFITLLGGAAVAWPLAARAQQPALPVVAFIHGGAAEPLGPYAGGFQKGLVYAREPIMNKTTAKDVRALLETASEMFDETGCVPGIDGEEDVPKRWCLKQRNTFGVDRQPGSTLRPGDMGQTGVYASPFVAGTKMTSEMP